MNNTYLLKPNVRQVIAKAGEMSVHVAYNAKEWVEEYPSGHPQLMVTTPGGARIPVIAELEDDYLIVCHVQNELLARPGAYSYVFVWTSGTTQLESGRCTCVVLGSDLAKNLVHDVKRTPDWAERIFIAAEALEGAMDGALQADENAQDAAYRAASSEAAARASEMRAADSETAAADSAADAASSASSIHTAYQLDHTQCTAVVSGDDLNSYTAAGNYAILSLDVAMTLTNSPSKKAGNLSVLTITTSAHPVILQTYVEYTGAVYTRNRTTNSETWSEWQRKLDTRDQGETPVNEHFRMIPCTYLSGKWTVPEGSETGGYEDAGWAYAKAKLNHGSVIAFDKNLYQVMYLIIDAATETTLLLPTTGFKSNGRIVVDTQGISDDYIVLIEVRPASGSGSVDALVVGKSVRVMNRDKIVDLFLFAGQSNMAGRGTAAQATAPQAEAGLEFRAITDKTRLYPITEPFGVAENKENAIDDGDLKTGDMVPAFINEYFNRTGVPVIGVSASKGGTAMSQWAPSGALVGDAIQRVTDARTFLTGKGYTIRHTYMAWCQGESDGSTSQTTDDEAYIGNFNAMWAAFKNNGVEKCFFIRIGNLNSSSGSYALMIEKQTLLTKTNPDVIMATTLLASYKSRNMMKDEFHYTQEAYNEMGTDAGRNAASYVLTGLEPSMYDPEYNNQYYPAYPANVEDLDVDGVASVSETLAYLGIN